MPKYLLVRTIIDILTKNGFIFVTQRGSHAKYRTQTSLVHTVIIPIHTKEIPYGTFRSIVRQSGLTLETFMK